MGAELTVVLARGAAIVEAVIFDMDGVLSDTQTIHAQIESELLRQHGMEVSPDEITREFAGMTDEEMFPRIFRRHGKTVNDLAGMIESKWRNIMDFSRGRVRPMPGALELVAAFKGRDLPVAVASSSRREFIELVITELGLRDAFDAVVSADEVARGKPDPAIFLAAAAKLGKPPHSCLVIEDSTSGMRAAHSAGMKCIGLVSPDGHQTDYPVDLLVRSLRQVSMQIR